MEACNLNYIPAHLHADDKSNDIPFVVGEELYRRCTSETLENPFKSISITELSHNRSGPNMDLSEPNDVLWSIREDEDFEQHELVVCTLKIIDLNENSMYTKPFEQIKKGDKNTPDKNVAALMTLVHEPEPCMFPHSVFRITLNDEVVTFTNYKDTLGKMNTIRTKIKEELANMIITREISDAEKAS